MLSSWYILVNFPKCHCETRPPQFTLPETKAHINSAERLSKCLFFTVNSSHIVQHITFWIPFFFFFFFQMAKATIRGNSSNLKFLAIPLSFQILGKIRGLASMCPTLFLSSINKQLGLSLRERLHFATQMIH